MDKLQYDSFYKFLVSLGIILIVAPFIGVYYFIFNTNNYLISNLEYENLTETSLIILQKRDDIYFFILNILPFIVVFLFILGCLILSYGIFKWKKFQKEIDEQTILKTEEQRINLKKMSPSEIIEKAYLEYNNMEVNSDELNIIKDIRNEDMYFELLKDKLTGNYDFFQNIKVGDCRFDIIAVSQKDDYDKIFELKMVKQRININSFESMVQVFKDMVDCYKNETKDEIGFGRVSAFWNKYTINTNLLASESFADAKLKDCTKEEKLMYRFGNSEYDLQTGLSFMLDMTSSLYEDNTVYYRESLGYEMTDDDLIRLYYYHMFDDECSWLKENSYKYGFIQRYPAGKENITRMLEHRGLYRYVGIDVAKIIHDNNWCLEEYCARYTNPSEYKTDLVSTKQKVLAKY